LLQSNGERKRSSKSYQKSHHDLTHLLNNFLKKSKENLLAFFVEIYTIVDYNRYYAYIVGRLDFNAILI
jgi:hypothetical protein